VRPKAVTNQYPGFLVSLFSRLGIKNALELLQADLRVSVPRFGARIVPSRGGERGPVASIGCSWPDDH
jgi:hypothetical protein